MPTPAQFFGFGQRPMASYFPSTYSPSQYDVALAGYNPLNDIEDEIKAQATADLIKGEFSGADAIPAIQRLVATGAMTPQQGASMARLQRYSQPRPQAGAIPEPVAKGIQMLSAIRPEDEDAYERASQVYQNVPELFSHGAGVRFAENFNKRLEQAKAAAQGSKAEQAAFSRQYANAIRMPSDEMKIQAAMRADKTLQRPQWVPSMFGPGKSTWDDETWSRAWHNAMDNQIEAFRATVLERSKRHKVPDELVNWAESGSTDRPPIIGGAKAPFEQAAAQPQQAAQQPAQPQGPQSTNAMGPNQMHIWKLKQDPSLAPMFDAKFGKGAAAKALSQ